MSVNEVRFDVGELPIALVAALPTVTTLEDSSAGEFRV